VTAEVLTVGRVSVDLYPEQIGVPLTEVRTFRKMLGGSPTNVAVGVDASRVGTRPALRTPLAFCEIFPPDRFPLLFYREPKAPDLELEAADLDPDEASRVPLLWTTGTGLSQEPSRSTTLAALARRGGRPVTVHDLDYRAVFWPSSDDAARWNREALSQATVAVGNTEEVAVVLGRDLPAERSARTLLQLGPEVAVVKLGDEGLLGATGEQTVVVPPVEVEVVNGLGAGDGFGGALCHGLLVGWPLERTLRFANAAGALVASRLGCADDMPTLAEVEELLCAA
jgi:5-dehydro-2-deoxygluconokinase